ncbi:MAG TPA: PAS domain S-box protein [Sphingobacteriaceae bacterium]
MNTDSLLDKNFLELAYGDLVMAFCLVDPNGITVYANRADEQLLGRTKAEMEGVSAENYFINKADFEELRRAWANKQNVKDYTATLQHKNGTIFRARISTCPLALNPAYTCIFKRNVELFQRRSDNLEILNNATRELAQARNTETALDKILKIVVPSLASWMTIDIFRKGVLTMLKIEHADNPKLAPAVDYKRNSSLAEDPSSFVYKTLHEGKVWYFPVVNEEILKQNIPEPERREFLTQFNISSAIIVPMYYNEQIYGAITFIQTVPGMHYSEEDLVLFQNLANHIALVLENVHLNEEAENEIRQRELAERYFRVIAEAVPQKILTADPTGKATYFNPQWEDFLGVSVDSLYEDALWSYIHPDDVELNKQKWQEALEHAMDFEFEHRFLHKDGTYRWQLTRARPVMDDQNRVQSWIASVTDIDDQKKAEEKKDEFITVASHELKTPLTSVKAYLQLLEKMISPSERYYSFLEKSAAQIKRLELLVSDLLDVSKISSGKIIYNMSDFNMAPLVEEVLDNSRHLHPEFELILERNDDFTFYGDRVRIEQVIVNLLNNAIKYSGDNRQVVVSSFKECDWFVIKIQDYGIGISKEHLRDVFLRFFRVNNTYQGVGLGLYIANEIAETHEGKIEVESELSAGTSFYFKLPLEKTNCSVD